MAKTIDTLSLARVRTADGEAPGFFVTPSNALVTIGRIATSSFAAVRFRDNTTAEATRRATDGIPDLAEYIVSVQVRAAIPIGTVKDVKAGDQVVIATLTDTGAVALQTSKVLEVVKESGRGLDLLRLDLPSPIDPKLDGSPVVSTATGKVVGVLNSTFGIGDARKFAVPIDYLPSLKQ
ncbi:MAG: hypothetical protein HY675_08100 [Chloroflexi bacterium]|nr:hypothetical protein [Chloroflexota bacterium]